MFMMLVMGCTFLIYLTYSSSIYVGRLDWQRGLASPSSHDTTDWYNDTRIDFAGGFRLVRWRNVSHGPGYSSEDDVDLQT